ncbi:hypothetical protein [Fusobacterium sp. IOR10]|uniref:hypothetical protein n=1 Tax=Fusobacterium sp. IOR10 TaxID=2665157 RepID=UPI0013D28576|nr:hypothetical protein [Fusobacterium sp. IOR10]
MFRIVFLFLMINILSFGKIEDGLNLLNLKDKRRIEKLITKIENSKDIIIYIKTVNGEESIQLENPQKTVMIIVQKINDEKVASELKFTEDLRMEDREHDLNLILVNNKDYMFDAKYEDYFENVLMEIDKLVDYSEKEEKVTDK